MYGVLQEWLKPSHIVPSCATSSGTYVRTSQADLRGSAEAAAFLQKVSAEWQPGQRFWRELSAAEEWPWTLFLAQERFQRSLRGEKVTRFGITWHKGLRCACFWGETDNGQQFQITPKTQNEFKGGWDDLSWC